MESIRVEAEDTLDRRMDFPKLEEDAMCSEEEKLFKLWKGSNPVSDKLGDGTQDTYPSVSPEILRVDTAKIRHPKQLYVDGRKSTLMMQMDSSIVRHRGQQRDTVAGAT